MSRRLCGRPYLAAEVRREGETVTVARGGAVVEVGVRDGAAAEELFRLVTDMRSAEWAGWTAAEDPELDEMIETFWTAGLIDDAQNGAQAAAAEQAEYSRFAHEALVWLRGAEEAVLRQNAQVLLDAIPPPRENFYLRVLALQLEGWQQFAPLSASLARSVLSAFARGSTLEPIEQATFGLYDSLRTRVHLHSLVLLLALSGTAQAARVTSDPADTRECSGISLVLEAERLALDATERLGTLRYHEALRRGGSQRLAAGTYLHQFHVTDRFVEVIAPLMATALRAPLHQRMFAYFDEERGHEVHELESCVQMGMTPGGVKNAMPLPLFTAYIDVLQTIAASDPLAFILCVLVAEGLPGAPTPVNDLLIESGTVAADASDAVRRHAEINRDLDHATLARRMAANIGWVASGARALSLQTFLLAIELNARCWNMLHDYYAADDLPLYPEWLAPAAARWRALNGHGT